MKEAKDICFICEKVEPTPTMVYFKEDKFDDRLICHNCKTKPKLDDLLKSNLSLEEIDEIIAFESWGDLSK